MKTYKSSNVTVSGVITDDLECELSAQRDDLLAALHSAQNMLTEICACYEYKRGTYDEPSWYQYAEEARDQARAAIARAEGK